MTRIRDLFSEDRPIDRPIEKVIDYGADDPDRLAREVGEYWVTDRLEDSFRRFIEVYDAGVRRGDITEVGIWVSGFYGSGKSSFTKYLGFALDTDRQVGDQRFVDRFVERFDTPELRRLFKTTATGFPATVVMLDLARDQLVESTATPITSVLYAKVLQKVGYSKVPKLADIEVRLDEAGRLDAFRQAYRVRFPGKGEWDDVHDDPLLGPARASHLVPAFFDDFTTPESFQKLHYQERLGVSELAARMIALLRRKTGRENIVFLVDEVGQYVAPRTDLMLNLDGLVRSFKELGRGKVWFVATAQQTLNEIVDRAILNSAELVRLRDRFPISIELDAADIREITHKRLLTKRAAADTTLRELYRTDGENLRLQTRVEGFGSAGANELNPDLFAQMYPFLPVHFDVVMALIRRLARRTGGTGLRSAIRVVQDLLVDVSKALPAGLDPLADRPVKRLACADDIYDTLRADIGKEFGHVIDGVDGVATHRIFKGDALALRVAKAIAALQPLDDFPRTAENLAAVLYPGIGEASVVEEVRAALQRLVEVRELGIVELRGEQDGDQPGAAGYLFLSNKVRPLQQTRDAHRPTGGEKRQLHVELLKLAFDPQPEVRLENVRTVRAGLYFGNTAVAGEGGDVRFLLESVSASKAADRVDKLTQETRVRADWQATVVWTITPPDDLDELLEEACRSAHLARTTSEHDADRDVAQYVRAERRRLERLRDTAQARLTRAMQEGTFVFRGLARPVKEYDAEELIAACNRKLAEAAQAVFPAFRHAAVAAKTNQAQRFLDWENLARMPKERDPLALVETRGGQPRIKLDTPPLSEVLRAFNEKVDAAGTGRLQGAFVQDLFAGPPYGWSKDTTRYLFAALLAAGEVELHTPAGVLRTPGPSAVEVFQNTATFNRVGLSPRGSRPSLEVLDRAARVLESLFGDEVLPLEDHISRSVRAKVPPLMERVGSLPDRLRLLGLPGEDRARAVLQGCSDLLQEDAGGAASLLGTPDSALPADTKWAREVADCLDADGESTVRRAAALAREVMELVELFPDLSDAAPQGPLDQVRDILGSEAFATRLADLRGALSALVSAGQAAYVGARSELDAAVQVARRALEEAEGWARLDPEDRDRIAQRLAVDDVPPNAGMGQLVIDLRRLATRAARVPTLLADCMGEVRRLAVPPREQDEGTDSKDRHGGGPSAQVVDLRALVPSVTLDGEQSLDAWLSALRQRLLQLVELGPVRIDGQGGE
jgi:hypothetical protein